ncbi:uncharacterized protein PGRI_063790 [Penicillium griseofulvum]|uniref:Mid2 domain-containing protein n=1 Tax=Penicillium patulum TaxID=5078 RepID=A0A135LPB7_PENPA|nr:uncharacterized protein PGRI_063790 [Penicillium griseofulvum]KXG50807.1 hypothetical protein PGRI_063790 [Penicillium griseofulvum]
MRSLSVLPVLSTLALLLNYSTHTAATPLGLGANVTEGNGLEKRCENPCGYNGWLCCASGQTCTTNSAKEAVCADGSASGGGDWEYYTSTYVLTNTDVTTITSVWSSQIAAPTGTGSCRFDLGETKCGSSCCDATQECALNAAGNAGQCVAESSSFIATATGTDATPGVRPTSDGATTVTATAAPTITEGFTAPVGTDGAELIGVKAGNNGLSGGAIAGIVIGSIVGAFLLLLLCACVCFKGILEGLFAALGFGKKRRRQDTTYIEEHHSHHSHGGRPPPPPGRTWFGTKPTAGGSEVSEKKESKWGLGTIAIIIGALALCLGLKRKRDREHDDDKTESSYPSSYYYYSDYYSGTGTEVLTDELEIRDDHDDRALDLTVHDI